MNLQRQKKTATHLQTLRWEILGRDGGMMEAESVAAAAEEREEAEATEERGGWLGNRRD